MFEILSMRDHLSFGNATAKFVPIAEDPIEESYVCLLASKEEFLGNSRFALNEYWVYPSIQTVFWKSAFTLNGKSFTSQAFKKTRSLLAWPNSALKSRQEIAQSLEILVANEEKHYELTANFLSDLELARKLSIVFVQAQMRGSYITKEALKSLVGKCPERLLKENLNLQVSLRTKKDLADLLTGFNQKPKSSELVNDYRKILLNRLDEVKKFLPDLVIESESTDYTKLFNKSTLSEAIVVKVQGNHFSVKNLGTRESYKVLVEIGESNE
jgi:hypothetical protein